MTNEQTTDGLGQTGHVFLPQSPVGASDDLLFAGN